MWANEVLSLIGATCSLAVIYRNLSEGTGCGLPFKARSRSRQVKERPGFLTPFWSGTPRPKQAAFLRGSVGAAKVCKVEGSRTSSTSSIMKADWRFLLQEEAAAVGGVSWLQHGVLGSTAEGSADHVVSSASWTSLLAPPTET